MAKDPRVVAVQKVLYEPARLRRLHDDLTTITVLMNLDPTASLPPDDTRSFAGSGPTWWLPGTSQRNPSVVDAARRCDDVARVFMEIRRDLATVAFPASDKSQLRLALAELAASWTARGSIWRTGPGADVEAAVDSVGRHWQASINAFRKTRKYLKDVRLG